MADNVTSQAAPASSLPPGTQVATDQLPDGTHAQRVKLMNGTLDSTTVVRLDETANGLKVDGSAVTQPISAGALPLPAGAATEAGHLAAIDTSTAKIPALGQALAAASVPIVLTAAQQAALTPPAAIVGFALDATLTGGTAKEQIVDAAGRVAGITDGITASNEATQDRLKVNAELRAVDPTQPVGARVVALPGSQTTGLLVSLAPNVLPDLLASILTELKIMNSLLQSGLNVQDSLDNMRADPYYLLQ